MIIKNMHLILGEHVKAYFACSIGSIQINNLKLQQRSNGDYFIVVPETRRTHKITGGVTYSKLIEILNPELEEVLLSHAIKEFEKIYNSNKSSYHKLKLMEKTNVI